jgi:hypothetical protein
MAENQKAPNAKIRGEPCPECGCPYVGDHTVECVINDTLKLKRIREILQEYYQQEEGEIAPQTAIERIHFVTRL